MYETLEKNFVKARLLVSINKHRGEKWKIL